MFTSELTSHIEINKKEASLLIHSEIVRVLGGAAIAAIVTVRVVRYML